MRSRYTATDFRRDVRGNATGCGIAALLTVVSPPLGFFMLRSFYGSIRTSSFIMPNGLGIALLLLCVLPLLWIGHAVAFVVIARRTDQPSLAALVAPFVGAAIYLTTVVVTWAALGGGPLEW